MLSHGGPTLELNISLFLSLFIDGWMDGWILAKWVLFGACGDVEGSPKNSVSWFTFFSVTSKLVSPC